MEENSNQTMREVINLKNTYDLSLRIKSNYVDFDQKGFNIFISEKLKELSLMGRILHVQNALELYLPKDFEKAVKILLKSQLPELNNDRSDNYESDFISVPMSNFVAKFGCTEKYFDISMKAQYEMTKRFSCEWSMHDFIENFEDKSFQYLKIWAKDDNCHVRRLCSECIRPRLPWSRPFKKFQQNPSRLFEILELLYFDDNRYVVRSVSNCLNDISKTHPKLVVEHLKKWESTKKQNQKEFEWIKKHSLRTLIKKGDTLALDYLGFNTNHNDNKINYELIVKTPIVKLNENLEFEVKIFSENKSKLIIDYLIYFVKANGKLAPKVFKLKVLENENKIEITKKYSFKKMTTRALYSGTHKIAIQINGKIYSEKEFDFRN